MEKLLNIENLKTYFSTDKGTVRAVDGISFSLEKGETIGIVGESGCGKSVTSLSVMRLLPEPMGRIHDGRICFHGTDLAGLSSKNMRNIRGDRISMIFQEPMTSLNPVLKIGYQLEEALFSHKQMNTRERKKRSVELLDMVGIPDASKRLNDYPHQLSGGMRQRAMIAMALACDPDLLIADEPTTALDVTIQAQILEILDSLQDRMGMSMILITHNLGVVAEMAHRIIVMYAGKIVEESSTRDLFEAPCHPYTIGLIDSIPELDEKKDQRHKLATIPGMVPHPFDFPEGCRFNPRCPHAMEKCLREEPPLFETGTGHRTACWLYEAGSLKKGVCLEPPLPALPEKSDREKTGNIMEIRDLCKYFYVKGNSGKHGLVKAVDGISLDITRGETLGLVGESGCGKTTTGKMIVGLEKPTRGDIFWKDKKRSNLDKKELTDFTRKVQMVFQDPFSSLNPRMTVKEIVAEGIDIHRLASSEQEREDWVAEALTDAGLRAEYMIRYPHEFSGGQRQRIGIARALAMKPELIVCDEPVSALDVSIQAQVINLLQDLQIRHDLTYLFVAHDLSVVRHIADRVAVMYLGKIMEEAETDILFESYLHPYTEALLSAVPIPRPGKKSNRIILEGDLPSPLNPPAGCPFSSRCQRKKGPECDSKVPPLVEIEAGHKIACWWYCS
jgi:peptide/nickel transport system ATP-binding protein